MRGRNGVIGAGAALDGQIALNTAIGQAEVPAPRKPAGESARGRGRWGVAAMPQNCAYESG
jgi:hypothetical protein